MTNGARWIWVAGIRAMGPLCRAPVAGADANTGEKAPSRALPEYGQRAETLSTNRPCRTASYKAAVLDTDVLSHKWEWAQVEMRTLCSSTVSFYSLDICLLLPGV